MTKTSKFFYFNDKITDKSIELLMYMLLTCPFERYDHIPSIHIPSIIEYVRFSDLNTGHQR